MVEEKGCFNTHTNLQTLDVLIVLGRKIVILPKLAKHVKREVIMNKSREGAPP